MVRLQSTDPHLQSGPVTLGSTIFELVDGCIDVSDEVAAIFWGHPTWRRLPTAETPLAEAIQDAVVLPVAVVSAVELAPSNPVLDAILKPPAPQPRIRRKSP